MAFADLQPGDLVFFHKPVSHVGIYAGGGKMIHAPQTGDVVRYQARQPEHVQRRPPPVAGPQQLRPLPLAGGGRVRRPAAARHPGARAAPR